MKAVEVNLLEFLRKSQQFEIPIYQRTYSWTERECGQLWEDILRAGGNNSAHFIGSIVYIQKGLYHVTAFSSLLVIDGQQRLTTVMLMLEALARHVDGSNPVEGFSVDKIRGYYLLNKQEERERRFKLLLNQTDKQSLIAIMQQKSYSGEPSFRIEQNFKFFEEKVRALDPTELALLCKGLQKIIIVDIALSHGQDNPQLIFESMNSTGRELSQADLIRNFILMGLEPVHQKCLYNEHWRPMELFFGQDAYGEHFDRFMRHYLTLKTGEIPKIKKVYEAFKKYAQSPEVMADALISDVHTYADYYCAMALNKEQDKDLASVFRDLMELTVNVAFPFLLELYYDYHEGALSKEGLVQAVRLIESYVFRRAVCSMPTNSLNKIFASCGRSIDKNQYIESIRKYFLDLRSYRRFPDDGEFRNGLLQRNIYNFPRRSYLLRRLENYERKELVSVNEYTIEHIMPQNENLSQEWQKAIGSKWKEIQKVYLHTIGNLTLTGYNSEYGDRPFAEKRDMEGGFKESPLWLNKKLATFNTWNEDTINQRAELLVTRALQVWAAPSSVLLSSNNTFNVVEPVQHYSYYPNLASDSSMRKLFEVFRKEVLLLDLCVSEEFLKKYVAYKAETNFVDVVPQKKQLLLYLNLRFDELFSGSSRLVRDVTNIGHYGNGDVEINLTTLKDIRYVMGLVRQSFERQMGNEEVFNNEEKVSTCVSNLKG